MHRQISRAWIKVPVTWIKSGTDSSNTSKLPLVDLAQTKRRKVRSTIAWLIQGTKVAKSIEFFCVFAPAISQVVEQNTLSSAYARFGEYVVPRTYQIRKQRWPSTTNNRRKVKSLITLSQTWRFWWKIVVNTDKWRVYFQILLT